MQIEIFPIATFDHLGKCNVCRILSGIKMICSILYFYRTQKIVIAIIINFSFIWKTK